MLHVIWSIVVGFFSGLIARAIIPGGDQMGFLATTAVGIVGSLIGGFLGRVVRKPEPGVKFHHAGFIGSIIGAVILLLILRQLK